MVDRGETARDCGEEASRVGSASDGAGNEAQHGFGDGVEDDAGEGGRVEKASVV